MRWLLLVALAACADDPIVYGDVEDDPQLPPRGMGPIETWLDAGHHKSWACEPAIRAAFPGSPHGGVRVCSNAVLAASSDAASLPVGATSVKEIYDAENQLLGHAVSRKISDDGPAGWYWYEFHSSRLFVDGMNTGSCPACHMDAQSEMTFVIVR